ncbi:hypothetical protein Tco_0958170 [Tanacetum coccineum]
MGTEFKQKSAWVFFERQAQVDKPRIDKRKNKSFSHFGDDALPRPPGLQRLAKSQRSGSNSIASSGSNPMMYQEFMKEQYELDRNAKMQVIKQESEERRQLIHAQRIAEEMRVLQIDIRGMDPANAIRQDCMEKNLEDDAGEILGVHSQGDCGNVTTDDNEDVTPVIVPEKDSIIAPPSTPPGNDLNIVW